MDQATFDSVVSALLRRTPFQPFTLVMGTGDRLEVDHPRAIFIFRNQRTVFVGPGGAFEIFNAVDVNRVIDDIVQQTAQP